ncbi:MAG: NAD(P)H-dependent oxidoreductase subunit E [Candidatus Omnitrophica bacterium]|nr:NAD(P)H-dependent oxidoreductase subunit E [Candidatus Omnitrophota bacterium]
MFDSKQFEKDAAEIMARYDQKKAATLPLLHLVQEKIGYIPPEGEQWVSEKVGVAIVHIREVVSFYTMFRTKAIGKHHIQVCTNLPCVLRGAEQVMAYLKERLGIDAGQTTPDGKFTLSSVECLCACEIAPMCQVNDRYIGPLDRAAVDKLLQDCV